MTNNSNTQKFRHLYFLFIFWYFLNVRNDCKTLLFFSYNFTIDVIYREAYYVTIISLNLLYLKKVTLLLNYLLLRYWNHLKRKLSTNMVDWIQDVLSLHLEQLIHRRKGEERNSVKKPSDLLRTYFIIF